MFDAEMLAMLRCPRDGKQLQLADASLVEQLNASIERGALHDRLGHPVSQALDGALLTAGGKFVYPIRAGIASLIADEAIVMEEDGIEPANSESS